MGSANVPFLDSSDVLDDRDRLEQRLDRDGYLFLKASSSAVWYWG